MNIFPVDMVDLINFRIKYLEAVIDKKQASLAKAPQGHVRGFKRKNSNYYYFRANLQDKNGTYIKKSNIQFARKLAQKTYDEKLIKALQKEYKLLKILQCNYEKQLPEDVISAMTLPLQELIVPIKENNESYLKKWLSTEYESLGFTENAPEYYSDNGERMRSKSEVLIANTLKKYGVPYKYEKPLFLKGYGMVYPDFTILDVRNRQEIYWEHFGIMDDREYRENTLSKIAAYEQNNLFMGEYLIMTFESLKYQLNMRVVELKIKHILSNRWFN